MGEGGDADSGGGDAVGPEGVVIVPTCCGGIATMSVQESEGVSHGEVVGSKAWGQLFQNKGEEENYWERSKGNLWNWGVDSFGKIIHFGIELEKEEGNHESKETRTRGSSWFVMAGFQFNFTAVNLPSFHFT